MNKSLPENPASLETEGLHRLSDTVASVKTAIVEGRANVTEALKEAVASADDFVRENPWIAIGVTAGIAGAVGFLAGLMAAPKKRLLE